MMQAAKDRQSDDLPVAGAHRGHRRPLAEALVRACGVEVADVLGDHAVQVPVVKLEAIVRKRGVSIAVSAIVESRNGNARRHVA